jgi:hypothetical protein
MKLSDQEKQLIDDELHKLMASYEDTQLIDALMWDGSFTKKGRLNKSGIGRFLGIRSQDVATRLQALQDWLAGHDLAL